MYKSCYNGGTFAKQDSRTLVTSKTSERVRQLLPIDILSRLPKVQESSTSSAAPSLFVMINSSLWDLSDGCNDQVGVTSKYAKLYETGIIELHNAIQETFTLRGYIHFAIYWRTSPPVSMTYDIQTTLRGNGRIRSNQNELNIILKDTVTQNDLGIVIDWSKQILNGNVSEQILSNMLGTDGRHYNKESSLAFVNLWLNDIFNRYYQKER